MNSGPKDIENALSLGVTLEFSDKRKREEDISLRKIESIEELALYSGKIVVFEGNFYTKGYHRINDKMFGYVHESFNSFDNGEMGYSFSVLYDKYNSKGVLNAISHDALTKEDLNRKIKMRHATEDEVNSIRVALSSGKVRFSSGDWKLDIILEQPPVPERPWKRLC